jgi:hypothetical protein
MWEVNQHPGVSSYAAEHDASNSSVQDNENRGVTAYRVRPFWCHRRASSRASS